MEAAASPPDVFEKTGRLPFPEDVFGVEPIHRPAALDSKGMDPAIARGPR
jgi:hypothetical protein